MIMPERNVPNTQSVSQMTSLDSPIQSMLSLPGGNTVSTYQSSSRHLSTLSILPSVISSNLVCISNITHMNYLIQILSFI
jgi:hypothetical protein